MFWSLTGEDAGKAIGLLDQIVHGDGGDGFLLPVSLAMASWSPAGFIQFTQSHSATPKTASTLKYSFKLILACSDRHEQEAGTGDHLDIDAQVERLPDGFRTVVPRRVEKGQQGDELPWAAGAVLRLLRHFL
jgi:hypothetical protein